MKKSISLVAGMLFASLSFAGPGDGVTFPENYRDNFTQYLSLNRTQNPDQYIRLYINDKGLSGTEEGGQLPYGSVIVAEIYKVQKDSEGQIVSSALGQRIATKLALLAVMERREGVSEVYPTGLKNDDWDFATFSGDGQRVAKDLNACAACHAPLAGSHHLFSYEHIIAEQGLK
ncbi:cytochrome P460 family protein [Pontibacter sp. JAM-7]|uniref:cytochrome P460 family protein n=1 Tax=Pontibacter sp. JAM-7 TaxID=3366581 RepID=UPI003AF66C9C